jgi:hypothetical protein
MSKHDDRPFQKDLLPLYNLCVKHNIEHPWTLDPHYDLHSLDTMTVGPITHECLGGVVSTFKEPYIYVKYTAKTIPQAILMLYARALSDAGDCEEVVVNDQRFNAVAWAASAEIFPDLEEIFCECIKTNQYKLKIRTTDGFNFLRALLVYPVTSSFEDPYYLNAEYARWVVAIKDEQGAGNK